MDDAGPMRKLLTYAAFAFSLCAAGGATQAGHQTFDVKGTDVDKGKTSIEANNTWIDGYPVNADRDRFSSQIEVGHGFTEWLKLGAKLNIDKPVDEPIHLQSFVLSAQIMLKKFERGVGLGWYTETAFATHRDHSNSVTYGPILQLGTEKTQLLINTFFTNSYGRNSEEGTEFSYAWAAKQEIREGLAIGVEGYGVIPNIANAPGIDFQPHRIGPVIYLERALAGFAGNGGGRRMSVKDAGGGNGDDGKPKFGMELGVLFGLTDATQDVMLKVKAGIEF